MADFSQLQDKIKEQLKLPRLDTSIFPAESAKKYAKTIAEMINRAESDEETINKRRGWDTINLLV